MRRSSLKFLVLFLLIAALVQPRPHEPPPLAPVQPSSTPQVDWRPLQRAIEVKRWNESIWLLTVAERQARMPSPTGASEGNQRAMDDQEAALDGDRFDRLAQCESGGDPTTNTGNGFYGAFQFMLASWRSAGGTGYPHEHSYAEQKSIAMYWASITTPSRQWPVCWPRSA